MRTTQLQPYSNVSAYLQNVNFLYSHSDPEQTNLLQAILSPPQTTTHPTSQAESERQIDYGDVKQRFARGTGGGNS